jgi:hypothetical protein
MQNKTNSADAEDGAADLYRSGGFLEGIDLAYAYVPSGGTSFRCLGKVLGVECEEKVEIIALSDDAMAEIMRQCDAAPASARTR